MGHVKEIVQIVGKIPDIPDIPDMPDVPKPFIKHDVNVIVSKSTQTVMNTDDTIRYDTSEYEKTPAEILSDQSDAFVNMQCGIKSDNYFPLIQCQYIKTKS